MALGSIIGGIGSVIGSIFGGSSASKDRKLQLRLAREGIQMRAADARAAGIHPLAALGANMPMYTPVGDGGVGAGIADAAAQFGSAIDSAPDDLQKDAMRADTDLKRAQAEALRFQITQGIQEAKAATLGVYAGGASMASSGNNPMPGRSAVNVGNPEDAMRVLRFPNAGNQLVANVESMPDADQDIWARAVNSTLLSDLAKIVASNVKQTGSDLVEFLVNQYRLSKADAEKVSAMVKKERRPKNGGGGW